MEEILKPLNAANSSMLAGGASFSRADRIRRQLWVITWALLAAWTPAPLHRWRCFLLRAFGARIGKGVLVYGCVRVWYPANLTVGDNACLGRRVTCYNQGDITIGARAIISQGAHLCASSHDVSDRHFQLTLRPIQIDADAWVAADAFVGPGVNIGEGAVLAARGVAFTDLDAWTIYRGNPAQPIKARKWRN
ncbi:putative colanic acid biosynthesis acetyltransferase [Novosphingobium sp. FSY-8]|uniref:Colanic acid biosynthesis acetyltransferase n=1 Tax=Novosphingobium ovatum TaxID=1908523 RepID=A0ABW9XGH3_9SPHN|nr:putative colanic acid biosynthesis acetyltransferase [Novosphingobium ovatum]NBC37647.1 putative colanic acid biosynthesis acetyltransferase [Novosphingobium ovatum]